MFHHLLDPVFAVDGGADDADARVASSMRVSVTRL
jgi:hypothetical protein